MNTAARYLPDSRESAATSAWEQSHPRSHYGLSVLLGRQNLSGSDLKGAARKWGGSYKDMRQAVVSHAKLHGGHIRKVARTGQLLLEWTDMPTDAVEGDCSLGTAWRY